jgi:hypothetical protein
MKRFKIVGLCLVAVFALSAVMASGAQAGSIGTCVKAAKNGKLYTGKFTDKLCKVGATKAQEEAGKENKYEFIDNAGNIPFTSEGGPSHLKGAAGEIACERGTDSGTFEGAKKDTDVFVFIGCKLKPFELVCKSYGAKEGEIITNTLASTLIDNGEKGLSGKEPVAGEVWEQETNAGINTDPVFGPGPWLASFECGGIPFAVSGSVSGVVEAAYVNAKLKKGKGGKETGKGWKFGKPTFKIAFTEAGGEQDLQTTFVNPLKENKVETGASIQEGTNEIILPTVPKGFEVGGQPGE